MLPVNFHKSFVPERRLIAALLEYAALGKEGTLQEISADTGIPMGKYNGKTPAIIDYSRGMGLITVSRGGQAGAKKPLLTAFGKIVYLEDKYLGEEIIQWLVHMNLCRSDIGAAAWRSVFADSRQILGSNFTKQQLEGYLIEIFGDGNDRTGPMILAYSEDAALGRAGVLKHQSDLLSRKKAPLLESYSAAYAAYILHLLEIFFPEQSQVTLSDFNTLAKWFDVCLWSQADIEHLLSIVERTRYIGIDRQMHPWILERRAWADDVWPVIFDGLG